MTKNKKLLIGLSVIVALAIVALGIYKTFHQTADDNVIRIGVILPLTGLRADLGRDCQDGINIALRKLQQRGYAANVELIFADSKGSVKEAMAQYYKLRDYSRVRLFIAAFSPICKALIPEVEKDGNMLVATIASSHDFAKKSKSLFRVFVSVDIETETVAKYVVETLHYKNIAMLSMSDESGTEYVNVMRDNIKKLGGSIVFATQFDDNITDFASISAKTIDTRPDAIYIYCNDSRIGNIIKAIRVLNQDVPIFTTAAIVSPSNKRQLEKIDCEKVYYPDLNLGLGDIKDISRNDICLIFAHDAMLLLGTSIGEAKSIGVDTIMKNFSKLENIVGAVGPISVTHDGDIQFSLIMKQYK